MARHAHQPPRFPRAKVAAWAIPAVLAAILMVGGGVTATQPEPADPPVVVNQAAAPAPAVDDDLVDAARAPEMVDYLDVLADEGLDLSRDEELVAVALAWGQLQRGGDLTGRENVVRAQVHGALPDLDTGQVNTVVDCIAAMAQASGEVS